MTTKVWILLAIAGLLLLWSWRRERFEATATIKNPSTWDAAEYTLIRGLVTPTSTLTDPEIQQVVGGFWSYSLPGPLPGDTPTPKGWSVETTRVTTADLDRYLDYAKRSNLFAEDSKRQAFKNLLQAYYIEQGQSVFREARNYTAPTGPTGGTGATSGTSGTQGRVERPSTASTALRQDIAGTAGIPVNNDSLLGYFVTQVQRFYDTVYLPTAQSPTLAAITGFVDGIDTSTYPTSIKNNFKPHLIEIIQNYFETAPIVADQGAIAGPTGGAGQQLGLGGGTGATGATGATGGTGSQSAAALAAASVAAAQQSAATSGTTTTSSSSSSSSTGELRLFGPRYTEVGSPIDSSSGSASGLSGGGTPGQYPAIFGGREAGYTSATTQTGPSLPPDSSLGTNLGSMFFPFSRTPGDLDLISDPFRVMNTFSLASYTPKTDPVPFMPDFSAFQK
jgi:hypothetical protein